MTIQTPIVKINNYPNAIGSGLCGETTTQQSAPAFKGIQVEVQGGLINRIKKIGSYTSPESRLILGATALATQPFIDWNNKKVDKETRKVSCARTIAKILAGTFTGYFIRKGCINLVEKWTETDQAKLSKLTPEAKAWATALLPTKCEDGLKLLKKHRNAVGTSLALLVMLVTNFVIDVPLTKALTNLFNRALQTSNKDKIISKGGN